MKIQELKKLDNNKLNEHLSELKNKSRELRFSIANSQLKDVRSLRSVKQAIARILTILQQRKTTDTEKKVEVKE